MTQAPDQSGLIAIEALKRKLAQLSTGQTATPTSVQTGVPFDPALIGLGSPPFDPNAIPSITSSTGQQTDITGDLDGLNPLGGAVSLGHGVGGNAPGVNPFFTDPGGGLVSQILSPSRQTVIGELINAGVIGSENLFHTNEQGGFQDLIDGNGNVTGHVNTDIIDEAIRTLPIPVLGQGLPPTQEGPSGPVQAPQAPSQPQQETAAPPSSRPNETGTVGDQVEGPIVGDGSGQVPNPPPNVPSRNDDFDPFGIFEDLLRTPGIFGGGGTVSQTPTGADNEGGFDLGAILGSIFGSGGQSTNTNQNSNILQDILGDIFAQGGNVGDTTATGGTATANGGAGGSASNILSDLIGAVTGGSADNALSNVIDFGISDYVADKQLEANRDALDFYGGIYNDQVNRLEPFRQSGLNSLGDLEAAARNNPALRDLFAGQMAVNPTTNVSVGGNPLPNLDPSLNYSAPEARSVDVNGFNPYSADDPRLQYLIDSGTQAVQNSAVAQGKLFSGDTLEALQDVGQNAALGRAREIQSIEANRDGLALASDNQRFGQELGASGFNLGAQGQQFGQDSSARGQLFGENLNTAGFNLNQDQNNIANLMGYNTQQFGQNFDANSQALGANNNYFSKLFETSRLGQNSAAQQGAGSSTFGAIGSNLIGQEGDIRTARTSGFANALSGFF